MLRIGTFVGDRYEIISRIGSGGMSDVYKANDHKLNRMVAIKVLKQEFCDNHNFVSRFKIEAQAAAKLTQANIVAIYDVGDEGDLHYIVMELVEGITLKDYIARKGRLENRETIGITIQVAQGLEAAHAQSIVHRDIKPQNIIISREGKVKVMDFGIAKAVTGNTINSEAIGSVHYISPEQARGGFCDARSDIYSLGITMYEMLTGVVPFDGDNTVSVALSHLQNPITPPRQLVSTITTSLEQIILKCTQKTPERRYASAAELIMDLRKSLVMPEGDFVVVPTSSDTSNNQESVSEADILIPPSSIKNADASLSSYEEEELYSDDISSADNTEESFDADEEDDYFGIPDEEEEEGYTKPSTADRILFVASIVLAVVILIMALYLIGRMTGIIKSKGRTPIAESSSSSEEETLPEGKTLMPDLINLTEEEAKKALKEAGLGMDAEYEASETIKEGLVMMQEYEEGEIIDKNIKVLVTISTGSQLIEIPSSLIGMTKEEAEAKLASLNLTEKEIQVIFTDQSSETYEEGKICGMVPASGLVKEGGTVILYVSAGKAITVSKMPNVIGQPQDIAKTYLEDMGLTVTVETKNSSTVPKGQVMEQSIAADTQVVEGTAVTIIVSSGPVKMPNLIGMTKEDALAALDEVGITPVIEEVSVTDSAQIGKVQSQSLEYNKDYNDETITIAIGIQANSTELPYNLVPGHSLNEIRSIIEGLNMGLTTHTSEEYSSEYPAGIVVRITPGAGSVINRGGSIEIVISKGPEPTSAPSQSESDTNQDPNGGAQNPPQQSEENAGQP